MGRSPLMVGLTEPPPRDTHITHAAEAVGHRSSCGEHLPALLKPSGGGGGGGVSQGPGGPTSLKHQRNYSYTVKEKTEWTLFNAG